MVSRQPHSPKDSLVDTLIQYTKLALHSSAGSGFSAESSANPAPVRCFCHRVVRSPPQDQDGVTTQCRYRPSASQAGGWKAGHVALQTSTGTYGPRPSQPANLHRPGLARGRQINDNKVVVPLHHCAVGQRRSCRFRAGDARIGKPRRSTSNRPAKISGAAFGRRRQVALDAHDELTQAPLARFSSYTTPG